MRYRTVIVSLSSFCSLFFFGGGWTPAFSAELPAKALEMARSSSGLGVVIGEPSFVMQLASAGKWTFYTQAPTWDAAQRLRSKAREANLLGKNIFVEQSPLHRLSLGDNLADLVVLDDPKRIPREEILRVLRPGGIAWLGDEKPFIKPIPDGLDDWTHPYHRADNNPQSADRIAKGPWQTQFLAEPMFVPMPVFTVTAGGRVFQLNGHLSFAANQNPWLNTLVCSSGFNGSILWTLSLPEGFLRHRNTVIATPEALYLGDNESCKVLEAATGKQIRELSIPGYPSWKWMGMEGDTLYALVGPSEPKIPSQPGKDSGIGHWSWTPFNAYDFKDFSVGFGFHMTALNSKTGEVLWSHKEPEPIDARAVCLIGGRIYYLSPLKFLVCRDATTGKEIWRSADAKLLDRIGPGSMERQKTLVGYPLPERIHPHSGFSTQPYLFATTTHLLVAGPGRNGVAAISTKDGSLLWSVGDDTGVNYLVLRPDAVYAVATGDSRNTISAKLDYATGQQKGKLPSRWNCVRVTGSLESIFSRAAWGAGTWEFNTSTDQQTLISPMRPGCFDGVIAANGFLYWGPYSCGACAISLYGHIAAGPKSVLPSLPVEKRLESVKLPPPAPAATETKRWNTWRGNLERSLPAIDRSLPLPSKVAWSASLYSKLTAPICGNGRIYVGSQSGQVSAVEAATGKIIWTQSTGGAIHISPHEEAGLLYAGSDDGWMYCWEAATGDLLWRFQVANAARWIPVYERISSTWPVAGGVLVHQGVVYAAAGIADYDGFFICALDARTGKLKWEQQIDNFPKGSGYGLSLQGPLQLTGGKLTFHAGTVYKEASFDLETGKLLTEKKEAVVTARTTFKPYLGDYAANELEYSLPDQHQISVNRWWKNGILGLAPRPENASVHQMPPQKWSYKQKTVATLLTREIFFAAGVLEGQAQIVAIQPADGKVLWQASLPAPPVEDGLMVDASNGLVISLTNGTLIRFSP